MRVWRQAREPRGLSFPRSAWERTSGRSASRIGDAASIATGTGRRASGRAFPRGAWEREYPRLLALNGLSSSE